jgi:hypothetical protein
MTNTPKRLHMHKFYKLEDGRQACRICPYVETPKYLKKGGK